VRLELLVKVTRVVMEYVVKMVVAVVEQELLEETPKVEVVEMVEMVYR
jgi:hypothetical protein